MRCGKGTRQYAQCGRTTYATPSENKRDGPSCRKQEQQQQSTGQNACGIATTNACASTAGTEASKSGSFKDEQEWGQEENGETSDAYMEYGLPPPRRIKPRRDRKMAKKQVHTMAKAEKVAPGSD